MEECFFINTVSWQVSQTLAGQRCPESCILKVIEPVHRKDPAELVEAVRSQPDLGWSDFRGQLFLWKVR